MLGQDLCPILEDEGYKVVETTRNILNITDQLAVERFLKEEKPHYLIHCAAYTNVDEAEEETELAYKVNANATEYIARACNKFGITMVYISTDYVFDGKKQVPYTSSDKPIPINIYGKTKLEGEVAVQKHCPNHYIIRTSWLYGHHGKNFVETMISLASKPELKVVDDQIGSPTWTVDLSNAIIDLIEEESEYGIYHLCSRGETSWYNFAKEIFEQLELEVNLIPCKTNEFPRKAKRPKYSVLENEGLARNWKNSLKDYLNLRS